MEVIFSYLGWTPAMVPVIANPGTGQLCLVVQLADWMNDHCPYVNLLPGQ